MAQLFIENLTKIFTNASSEKVRAVEGVSLKIEEQELVTLVGPSGSGKTTLLRLVAGLEKADSGTIILNGIPLNQVPPKDRDIAMVFQNYALYPQMSVFENLAFGLKLRRVAREEIKQRVTKTAGMLGLVDLLERDPQTLSGGQRQRVALGRALVRRTKLILLDEPLSGLDARLRTQMRREISQLQKQLGLTMLYVTHDQTEAMSLGDRIAVMNQGRIQQVASPGDIYLRPCNRFVAEFFGTPPMNFFCGTMVRRENKLLFQQQSSVHCAKTSLESLGETKPGFCVEVPEEYAGAMQAQIGKEVTLAIRPENIQVLETTSERLNQLEATTKQIEMLGADKHVHLDIGTSSCIARVAASNGLSLNRPVSLIFQMTSAHFFDQVSGRRIET